ncbi:MAG: hypothetical protein OXR66_01075 [Candidatus Woesearchaeota archaeon]|nr:hypothetical protein [Candidatus Woesearchaeota archaeon]
MSKRRRRRRRGRARAHRQRAAQKSKTEADATAPQKHARKTHEPALQEATHSRRSTKRQALPSLLRHVTNDLKRVAVVNWKRIKKRPQQVTGHITHISRDLRRITKKKQYTHFKKDNLTRNLMGIVFFVFLFFVAVTIQYCHITTLNAELSSLQEEFDELQQSTNFYKKAYEITLEDIRKLSASFGGAERYDTLAAELREDELGILAKNISNLPKYTITNPTVWTEYNKKEIIETTCLHDPFVVDTIQEEVLVTVNTRGGGTYTLYADANPITSEETFSLILPKGPHALDIVVKEGTVIVQNITMDDVVIPTNALVSDAGEGLHVFDCVDVHNSSQLQGPGALRLLIEKQ